MTRALALAAGLVAAAFPARAAPDGAPAKPPEKASTNASTNASAHASRFDRCFLLAGERYGVSPLLLKAIARQESGLNPTALNRNANGSTDVGLMQINSSWLPVLARHGVKEADLRVPCANILVGAWILGSNFRSMGRNADALGAYNARDPVKRLAYARQVLRHYTALHAELHAELQVAPRAGPGTPDSVGQVR